MQLLTKAQQETMRKNGQRQQAAQARSATIDFQPVVKLFTPDGGATWLLTELDPEYPDLAFGLCDLGLGSPELGTVSLTELGALRGQLGLPVERDLCFKANKTLRQYADEAYCAGRIMA